MNWRSILALDHGHRRQNSLIFHIKGLKCKDQNTRERPGVLKMVFYSHGAFSWLPGDTQVRLPSNQSI